MPMKQKKKQISEQELLETIDTISKKLAYKFKFGYHEIEDMQQQISIFALEGLRNYDYKRPLENFLWTHVRNRLFNFKRDNYQRPDKPCKGCPFFDDTGTTTSECNKYTDKSECVDYSSWSSRNISKKNLMHLNTIEELKQYLPNNDDHSENVSNNEILDRIEAELNGDSRRIYLKLKMGIKIPKAELIKLTEAIREIVDE
jgi:DNA-directed RNA polymerase specialized sigma24 family protein